MDPKDKEKLLERLAQDIKYARGCDRAWERLVDATVRAVLNEGVILNVKDAFGDTYTKTHVTGERIPAHIRIMETQRRLFGLVWSN